MVRGDVGEDQKIGDVLISSREDARARNHPGVEASQMKTGTDACSLGSSESPALLSGFFGDHLFLHFLQVVEMGLG